MRARRSDFGNESTDAAVTSRLGRLGQTAPYLAVLLAVVAANVVYLTGLTKVNPYILRSGMGVVTKAGFIPGGNTIDPNDGFTAQALGITALHQWGRGEIPWWNPYEGLGSPLIGEMQSAATFPLLPLQGLPHGFLIYRITLELIAGFSTVWFAILLGLGRLGAGVAGVLFALNGTMVWLTNAASVPVAFLPLILVGVQLCADSGRRRQLAGIFVASSATALLLTGGFPEQAFLCGLLAACYMLWQTVRLTVGRLRFLASVASAAIIGLAIATPSIATFVEYVTGGSDVGIHTGQSNLGGLPSLALTQLFAPYSLGPVSAYPAAASGAVGTIWGSVGGYATAALAATALVGSAGRRLRSLRLLLLGWAVIGLCEMFAIPGISAAVAQIPGMARVATDRYFSPSFIFCLVVLAALTIDDLARRSARLRPRSLIVGSVGAVVCLTWIPLLRLNSDPTMQAVKPWAIGSSVWAGISLTVVAAGLLLRNKWGVRMVAAVLVMEAIAFFLLPSLSAPRSWRQDAALVSFMRTLAAAPGVPGRVYVVGGGPLPNYGSFFNVSQLNVNDLPVPGPWARYVRQALDPAAEPLVFLTTGGDLGGTAHKVAALTERLDAYRYAGVEYIFFSRGYRPREPLVGQIQLVTRTTTTDVYRLIGSSPYASAVTGNCSVDVTSRTDQLASCSGPGRLIRREIFYPGWQVTVNGTKEPIASDDGTFQFVSLASGTNVIHFFYRPTGWPWIGGAALLGFVAWLGLGTLVLVSAYRRVRHDSVGP